MAPKFNVGAVGAFKGSIVEIVLLQTIRYPIPHHTLNNGPVDLLNKDLRTKIIHHYNIRFSDTGEIITCSEGILIKNFKDLGENGKILFGR